MKLVFYLLLPLSFLNSINAQQKNLPFYIQQAKENSPLLRDYQNQMRATRIDSMKIVAGFGLQINGICNNSYAPVIHGWGYDEIITNIANITAQLSVTKTITGKQNRENQFQALQIQNQSLFNSSKISEQDLIKDVTLQYITAYGSWQQYKYSNDLLELFKREERVIKRLTEQNIYKQTDYLSFLVTMQQQVSQNIQAKGQFLTDLFTLNYLCGLEDTTFSPVEEPELHVAALPDIKNSIFYQSFINDSLKLGIEDKQIDFTYTPKVNLFGDAGYNSSLLYRPWKNFGASAGINLSIPIYDGRQRKMLHEKNLIASETVQFYRGFYVNQYKQQINQLFQQLKTNGEFSESMNQQLIYARTLIEANGKLLETGDVGITEFIMSVNNYLLVKNAIIHNVVEKYLLINQINYWSRTK